MRVGLSVAFAAMLLQLAVFLQPLLPKEIRISLVCAMIAEIDLSRVNSLAGSAPFGQRQHNRLQQAVAVLGQPQPVHTAHLMQASFASMTPVIAVAVDSAPQHVDQHHRSPQQPDTDQHMLHHDLLNHQQHATASDCPYCLVYSHLITGLGPMLNQPLLHHFMHMLIFKSNFVHIYFALQRLYLFPQGRAPPF